MRCCHFAGWAGRRKGTVVVIVAVALVTLMAAAALVFDLGQIVIAADLAQRTADAAAMAGAGEPIAVDKTAAANRAVSVVIANGIVSSYPLTAPTADLVYYTSGQTVPHFRTLGTGEEAMTVVVQAEIDFSFARIFGLTTATAERSSTAARVHAAGASIVPMFISANTALEYGDLQELHASSDPSVSLPPGSYGWVEPQSGDFSDLLCGFQVPQEILDANFVGLGEELTGATGQKTGQWAGALQDRLDRASVPPYSTQTPTEGGYTADNPRVLLVPMVEYVGLTGSNATFRILSFGAFWLESVVGGNDKTITGRFLKYEVPGSGDTPLDTGLLTVRLVD